MTPAQKRDVAMLAEKLARFRAMVDRMEKVAAELPKRDLTLERRAQLPPEERARYAERLLPILPDGLIDLVVPIGDACNLFSMLITAYELPPAVQVRVELASRFFYYAFPRLGYTLRRPIHRFRLHLRIYHRHLRTAEYAMRIGVLRKAPRRNAARPTFEVVFLKTYSPKLTRLILGEVRALEARLRELGWHRLIYGRIFLGRTLGREHWNAFYDAQTDVIFASRITSKTVGLLRQNLAHEIGHRLDFRFLQGHTEKIIAIFTQMKKAKNSPYVAFDMARRLLLGKDPRGLGDTTLSVNLFEIWWKLMSFIPEEHRQVFVSWYAELHPMENFAEMFRQWCFSRWRDLPHQRQFVAVTQLATATRADSGFMPEEYQRYGVPGEGML